MMEWVGGHALSVLTAETISTPQTSTHAFDFRKTEASARNPNVKLQLQSCGPGLPAPSGFRFIRTAA